MFVISDLNVMSNGCVSYNRLLYTPKVCFHIQSVGITPMAADV